MKGIIKWAAPKPTEYNGKKSLGIKLEGANDFLNCYEKLELNAKILKSGNEIEFESKGTTITKIKLIKEAPKKNEEIIKIAGKNHMLYKGLLALAHKKDPKFSMRIRNFYVSDDMKKAWCIVRLESKGQIFDGFGSSTPENTGSMTQTHPVEMSNTRAKGRALRDFLNIGEAMAEELKHDD